MRGPGRTLPALVLFTMLGCATSTNLPGPIDFRSAGSLPAPPPVSRTADSSGTDPATTPDEVRVATFNLKFGLEVDSALALIRRTPELLGADLLLLQEMDAEGTKRLATALGTAWVYYPAVVRDGDLFGNAILSRWPLSDDRKLILPHRSAFTDAQRIAVAATADIRGARVRVYSVHLETPFRQGRAYREEQLEAILDDAESYDRVIIGGDLNSHSIAELAVDRGYFWPTREGPRTTLFARVDHLLYRGLVPPWGQQSGTVEEIGDTSDHLPVWARGWIR